MADCKNCHYGAEGGGGNFGMLSIVCCYYGSLECDPAGDCQNFEAAEHPLHSDDGDSLAESELSNDELDPFFDII